MTAADRILALFPSADIALRPSEIRARSGLNVEATRKALYRLKREGRLHAAGHGRYTRSSETFVVRLSDLASLLERVEKLEAEVRRLKEAV